MSFALALLIDSAIKASLLCLAGLAAHCLAARRSAALRHDIWLAALACAALLPVAALLVRALPAGPAVAPVHAAAKAIAPMLPLDGNGRIVEAIDQIWSGSGTGPDLGWLGKAVLALWLAGTLLAAARSIAAYAAAGALARRAMPFPRGGARVLLSAEMVSPAVFGAFRPVILLPADAAGWPAARLRAVIAHEAAHVRRRDGLIDLVVRLACILHWYNPLVRHAAGAARAERELACDERVLAGGVDPQAYAETLVAVARRALAPSPAAMLAMARRPELESRIRALLAPARARDRANRLFPGLAVLLILPLAATTAPSAGMLGPGSVQPADGPLSGLDDPLSERVPIAYEAHAGQARAVPTTGPEAAAIRALQAHLDRRSHGYGDLVRERAIWALTQVRDGELFEPVSRYAADPDWRLRAYAAWTLAAIGDRRATPLLAPMLRDPVWRVRAMAAAALNELGDPRAAATMAEALHDRAWQVRISAAHYIAALDDPALTRLLLPLRDDPHSGTRESVTALLAGH